MKRSYKIVLHLCYWLYSLGLLGVLRVMVFEQKPVRWDNMANPLTFSYLFIGLLVFYSNYFFVLPTWFRAKKFAGLWLAWICLLVLGIGLRYTIEEVLYMKWFGIRNYNEATPASYYIFDNLYFIGIYIVMSTVFWTVDFWITTEKEKNHLQQEKFNAEMSMLRNQVNPHFLFNTLNNIYSLSYSKSDKAPESILKLSELMRYMLKDSAAGKVMLSRELDYIRNFIDLQQLRYNDPSVIVLSLSSDDESYMIAPLLLIPFVENGFKHGNLNDETRPLRISITALSGRLHLRVQNSKTKGNKDESSGIGLDNVRKRLDLLYPGNYTLSVQETREEYICELDLNL